MKTLGEYVQVYDEVVSEQLAAGLLDEYSDSNEWMSFEPEKGGVKDAATGIAISRSSVIGSSKTRDNLSREVVESLKVAFDKYHARYSRRDEGLNFLHIEKLVGLRLVRYKSGQFMKIHTDKYPDAESGSLSWPAVTFTLNLNDNYSGGELVLLDGDLVFKAKARQGIFFPSNFLFPHSVERVQSGVRFALVGWFL